MRGGGIPTIELFSGAGLLGLAFKQEGFRIDASYEFDASAAATCALNVCGNTRIADLSKQKPEGKCRVILAGPPCQGFSSIGNKNSEDPRNSMALVVPRWAKATGAVLVVAENVPPFLVSPAWQKLTEQMSRFGFEPIVWTLNAKHFRVSQNRVRAFTVYSKVGSPRPPKAYAEVVTVREAFEGLPSYPKEKLQHFSQPQSTLAMSRIKLVPRGGDIRDIARKNPRLVPKSWTKTGGKVVDIWGRLSWNGVSNTIRTGFLNPSRGRYLHPDEDRPISFREAARLQSVPDWFHFESNFPSYISRQIGNGVPVNLGRAVAKSIMEILDN